mgnify:CR=1 FL=1
MPIEGSGLKGFAVVLPSQQNQMRYNANLERQARLTAENKAKMFADDLSYTNAMNPHDNAIVKQNSLAKIQEMGSFFRSNPNWETDPSARLQYNNMVRGLKDNPDLNRGLQSDSNFALESKWMTDPKNRDLAGDAEFQRQRAIQRENYRQWGNQLGKEAFEKQGKVAYQFQPPEELVDTTERLMKLANQTKYDTTEKYQNGGYKQSISNSRKQLQAQGALSSADAKYYKLDYKRYLDSLPDPRSAKTIVQFTQERMEPGFASEKIDKGFAPQVAKVGDGKGGEMTRNLWLNMHDKMLKDKIPVDFGADAMQKTFGNSKGELNLNGVKDPFGNTINLGMRRAVANGLAQAHEGPNNSIYGEYSAVVRLPVDEIEALGKDYAKVVDETGLGQFTPGVSSTWDINEDFKGFGFKKYTDDKGRAYVEFPVNQKYDPLNPNLSDNYANAHNISPRKEEALSTEENHPPVMQGGKQYNWNIETGQYE